MNYSKKGTSRKQKALKSNKARMGKKVCVVFLKTLLVLILAVGVAGLCGGIGIVKGVIENAPDITSASVLPRGYKSTVYDAEGNKTAELVAEGTNRTYVKIENIPKHVQQAFIAIEDERFYEHNGIDFKGILRAGATYVASGFHETQGGSTITQQLLKNNVFDFMSENGMVDKIERKLQEQYLAVKLEEVMTKDEILESYLNTINLGQNSLGVQAASNRYFGKNVSELTLSEAAVLAAITKSPNALNPITHPEENAARRTYVLKYMLDQGYISQSRYEEAMADDVYSRIREYNAETETSSTIYSYFDDEVIDQVRKDLVEKAGYSETQAFNALYGSGLKIYTTQDPKIQQVLDEEFANPANFPENSKIGLEWAMSVVGEDGETKNYSQEMLSVYFKQTDKDYEILYDTEEEARAAIDEYVSTLGITDDDTVYERCEFTIQPQASMVIMNQSTGEVVAMIGGRGEKTGNRTLNRASDACRNPGSTFKIVAAYAPAFEALGYGPGTVQYDGPFAYNEGGRQGRLVNNWDKNTQYRGWTTLREGITRSMNVMAVKTITDVTPTVAVDYLLRFGFTSLELEGPNADYNQSAALGGLTNGVSNLELTAAYAAIANKGTYIKPRLYTKVVDNDGNVILDNQPETTQVISEQNAWLLVDCMKDVVNGAGGTGSKARISGMTTAGKTGTTSKNVDVWFEGMTPYYTAGIWVGYDNSGYNHSLNSAEINFHKQLWGTVMTRVHEGLENKDFEKPSGIVQCVICTKSGKLAVGGLCDADGRSGIVRNEYFVEGKQPTEVCDHHVAVSICVDTGLLATSMCPNRVPQAKVLLPAMQSGVAEAVTLDTAYGINTNLPSATCTLHTGGVYVPSEYELSGSSPGAVPDPNAGVDPNAGADPNAGVDPNAGADPNAGVDPNAGADP
ncbi:MAG: PBP1A family penicillin-binding protein, partial [Lachnospiraceae bacterium]|nr:PBP1A family penicillin-binding protein [Lachnospiraceae bacterium]